MPVRKGAFYFLSQIHVSLNKAFKTKFIELKSAIRKWVLGILPGPPRVTVSLYIPNVCFVLKRKAMNGPEAYKLSCLPCYSLTHLQLGR
jgi:hypothetical protein